MRVFSRSAEADRHDHVRRGRAYTPPTSPRRVGIRPRNHKSDASSANLFDAGSAELLDACAAELLELGDDVENALSRPACDGDGDVGGLPAPLAAFQPIAKSADVQKAAEELAHFEYEVAAHPTDSVAVDALSDRMEVCLTATIAAIEQRLDDEDIVSECDRVIDAGNNDFSAVYASVNAVMISTEPKGMAAFEAAVERVRDKLSLEYGQRPEQQASDGATLLAHAAMVKPHFDVVAKKLAEVAGPTLELTLDHLGRSTDPGKRPRTGLKKMARVIEKATMAPGDDRSCTRYVCDVVRAMLVAPSMGTLAHIVEALVALSDARIIVLLRIKDRWTQPSAGGWRDLMVNFYLTRDERKHVCELQLAHSMLVTARKGLPGHAIYSCVRNASELLERVGMMEKKGRAAAVAACNRVPLLLGLVRSKEQAMAVREGAFYRLQEIAPGELEKQGVTKPVETAADREAFDNRARDAEMQRLSAANEQLKLILGQFDKDEQLRLMQGHLEPHSPNGVADGDTATPDEDATIDMDKLSRARQKAERLNAAIAALQANPSTAVYDQLKSLAAEAAEEQGNSVVLDSAHTLLAQHDEYEQALKRVAAALPDDPSVSFRDPRRLRQEMYAWEEAQSCARAAGLKVEDVPPLVARAREQLQLSTDRQGALQKFTGLVGSYFPGDLGAGGKVRAFGDEEKAILGLVLERYHSLDLDGEYVSIEGSPQPIWQAAKHVQAKVELHHVAALAIEHAIEHAIEQVAITQGSSDDVVHAASTLDIFESAIVEHQPSLLPVLLSNDRLIAGVEHQRARCWQELTRTTRAWLRRVADTKPQAWDDKLEALHGGFAVCEKHFATEKGEMASLITRVDNLITKARERQSGSVDLRSALRDWESKPEDPKQPARREQRNSIKAERLRTTLVQHEKGVTSDVGSAKTILKAVDAATTRLQKRILEPSRREELITKGDVEVIEVAIEEAQAAGVSNTLLDEASGILEQARKRYDEKGAIKKSLVNTTALDELTTLIQRSKALSMTSNDEQLKFALQMARKQRKIALAQKEKELKETQLETKIALTGKRLEGKIAQAEMKKELTSKHLETKALKREARRASNTFSRRGSFDGTFSRRGSVDGTFSRRRSLDDTQAADSAADVESTSSAAPDDAGSASSDNEDALDDAEVDALNDADNALDDAEKAEGTPNTKANGRSINHLSQAINNVVRMLAVIDTLRYHADRVEQAQSLLETENGPIAGTLDSLLEDVEDEDGGAISAYDEEQVARGDADHA